MTWRMSGKARDCWSMNPSSTLITAAAIRLSTAKTASVPATATTFARKTSMRAGRCVRMVLNVPHPYSLPTVRTPRINASTPPSTEALPSASRTMLFG